MTTEVQSVWIVKFKDRRHGTESHLNVMAVTVTGAVKAAREWLSDDYREVEEKDERLAEHTVTGVQHLAEIHWPLIATPPGEDS